MTLLVFLLTFSNQTKFKMRKKNRSPLEFKALGVASFKLLSKCI